MLDLVRDRNLSLVVALLIALIMAGAVANTTVLNGFISAPSPENGSSKPVATSEPTTTLSLTPTLTPTKPATPSPTRSPARTRTFSSTATRTAAPTATTARDPYQGFKRAMLFALENTAEERIRFRGMEMVDTELYFIVNYTAESQSWADRIGERRDILEAYAWVTYWHIYDNISGKAPSALRILEINNTDREPKAAYVGTTAFKRWVNQTLSDPEFGEIVSLGTQNQTAKERAKVRSIDRQSENRTYHNESA